MTRDMIIGNKACDQVVSKLNNSLYIGRKDDDLRGIFGALSLSHIMSG